MADSRWWQDRLDQLNAILPVLRGVARNYRINDGEQEAVEEAIRFLKNDRDYASLRTAQEADRQEPVR